MRECVSARTVRARRAAVQCPRVEFLLHLWDELDDIAGVCRHLAASTAAEVVATAAPLIAAASGALLAGTATLLIAQRALFGLLA